MTIGYIRIILLPIRFKIIIILVCIVFKKIKPINHYPGDQENMYKKCFWENFILTISVHCVMYKTDKKQKKHATKV